jgi:hypothetical protein
MKVNGHVEYMRWGIYLYPTKTPNITPKSCLIVDPSCSDIRPLNLLCNIRSVSKEETEHPFVLEQNRGLNDLHVSGHTSSYWLKEGQEKCTKFCSSLSNGYQYKYKVRVYMSYHNSQSLSDLSQVSCCFYSRAGFDGLKEPFKLLDALNPRFSYRAI